VDFDVTDQPLSRYSTFVRSLRKMGKSNGPVHQMFVDFEKAYDSMRSIVQYSH
jgi:hypothetical protein